MVTHEEKLVKFIDKNFNQFKNTCMEPEIIPTKLLKSLFKEKEMDEILNYLSIPRIITSTNNSKFVMSYTKGNSLSIQWIGKPSEIEETVKTYQNQMTTFIENMLTDLDETAFDNLLNEIFKREKIKWVKDFKLREKKQGDEGIDFTCNLLINELDQISKNDFGKWTKMKGQIKHKKKRTPSTDIRNLRGSRGLKMNGFFISTNGFSGDAKENASKKPKIFLISKKEVAEEIVKHNFGLEKFKLGILKEIDYSWWNEIKTSNSLQ